MSPWQCDAKLGSYTFYLSRTEFISTHSRFKDWVLVAPESGEFDFEIDGQRGHVGFGEFVCVAPRGRFWRHVTTSSLTYHVFIWSWLRDGEAADGVWQPGKWAIVDTVRFRANLDLLRPLVGLQDLYARRRVEQLFLDTLMLAWEARFSPPPVLDPLMRDAARLLRERALGPLSMKDVSNAAGLSPVQFTRRFRAAHGVTPVEFLTRVRLEHARALLIMSGDTLDEIAGQCGWASGQYLAKVFAAEVGMSPGRFRGLHRV